MGDITGTISASDVDEISWWLDNEEPIDGRVLVSSTNHELLGGREPAEANDGAVRVWVLGEVYGFDDPDRSGQYEPRPPAVDSGTYCANLYEAHGPDFVRGLNGSYACVLYDRSRESVFLYTDRLGTVPVYFGRSDDASLVFSSDLQELPRHPWIETTFDPAYLGEYFAFKRVYGVKTPLTGIEELRPGTIHRFDLADGKLELERHWEPRYRPQDIPFDQFVDRFVQIFTRVMDEWVRDDLDYGLLLSGGSDSRLIMHGLGPDATAFHMADWMNREARTAERSAIATRNDFAYLWRPDDYQVEALDRNGKHANFNGWFTQPYTSGFEDEITRRVDVLASGMYGDALFKRHSVSSPTVSLGPVGEVTLPIESTISTIEEYIDHVLEGAATNREYPVDLRSVLEENIYRKDGRIVHHGVSYPSIAELAYYDTCYPLSNDDDAVWGAGLRRMVPYRTPYLDNRLVNLSLALPIRHRLRNNVINRALERLSPRLARIPHADSGVPLTASFPVEYLGRQADAFRRKHISREEPPRPYYDHGSWTNDAELIRQDDFLSDLIDDREEALDRLPLVDAQTVRRWYREHRDGRDRLVELYTVATVLAMPTLDLILEEGIAEDRRRTALLAVASDGDECVENDGVDR